MEVMVVVMVGGCEEVTPRVQEGARAAPREFTVHSLHARASRAFTLG